MSYHHTVNQSIAGASSLIRARLYLFTLKTLLKANGWTVRGSGTGNTGSFDNAGVDLWVTAASVVGEGAWIRLRHTVTGTEVVFAMRDFAGAEENLGFLWSRAAQFSGGSPSATALPTATDQVLVADRTLAHCALPTADFKAQFICDDASPAHVAYGSVAGPTLRALTLFDWCQNAIPGDTSPGVGWWVSGFPLNLGATLTVNANGGGYDYDDTIVLNRSAGTGLSLVEWLSLGVNVFDTILSAHPRSGNRTFASPLVVALSGTSPHVKGTSRLLRQVATALSMNDTLDSKKRWVLSSADAAYSVPGDGVTTPVSV